MEMDEATNDKYKIILNEVKEAIIKRVFDIH